MVDEFDVCVVFVAILTNSVRRGGDDDAGVLGDMVVHLRVAGGCDDDQGSGDCVFFSVRSVKIRTRSKVFGAVIQGPDLPFSSAGQDDRSGP